MTRPSQPDLLVLHAVRLLGFADTGAIARRFGLDLAETARTLRVAEERGWVGRASFAGLEGWSLTEEGKAENEAALARERLDADPDDVVGAVYRDFLPLNARLLRATTDWQLKPDRADPFAANDHRDADWDARVLDELAAVRRAMIPLVGRLTRVLTRFDGYDARYSAALQRAWSGAHEWVDRTSVDSCHTVWFQLHEDLLATQGVDRSAER
ncbi:transcriptional regulator [Georgenia faecalis]|uniref:Transcriptional regulator n=1 Tax=Georgenia faecalis TaxID=2483799 RepID=A0ABV9D893_9MICO|nr:transcriptional regulator [Georgenia faecalis]